MAASLVLLTPAADTALWENNPSNNLGGMTYLPVGASGLGQRSRPVFKFPIAERVPSNAVVASVTLSLTVTAGHGEDVTHDLYRLLVDWGEGAGAGGGSGSGSQGALAQPGEATWSARFFPSPVWYQSGAYAGTDYAAVPSASTPLGSSGVATFASPEMIADVQGWLNHPESNFGWILISEAESTPGTARRVASREDPLNSPALAVAYTLPSVPPPVLTNVVLVGNEIRCAFLAEAHQAYVIETNLDLVPTGWGVLTNIPALSSASLVRLTHPATASRTFLRIRLP